MRQPKLKTVVKVPPPYPLNQFPPEFPLEVGKELIFALAAGHASDIRGEDWERIFAQAVGAEWQPSNVGLDDVQFRNCAWGAKTVKAARPATAKRVRLISGRNSPAYSFDETNLGADAGQLGSDVLAIWNARVASIRARFEHLRTVVLLKSKGLTEFACFEFETVIYPPDQYEWRRNAQNNLEGRDASTGQHQFTWQPHGSQFTIIEPVPSRRLAFRIRHAPILDREKFLEAVRFDDSWVKVISD